MPRRPIHNFCTVCGTAFVDQVCPKCSVPDRVSEPERQIYSGRHQKLFKGGLVLYFLILASFIPFALKDNLVELEIAVTVVDSAIVFLFVWHFRISLLHVLKLPKLHWWFVAIPLAAVLFILNTAYAELLIQVFKVPYQGLNLPAYEASGVALGFVFILICVQPGVVEELAFRGLVFDGLRIYLTPRETLILSSFMFSILHLSVISLPSLFLVGFMLAILRQRSQSLYPGMLLHAVYNFFCILWEMKYPIAQG